MKKIGTTEAGLYLVEMTEDEFKTAHERKGVRKNVLRVDAKVGTATKKIERDYGLPKGSVRIMNQDGRAARSDKLIGSVLSDYGYFAEGAQQKPAKKKFPTKASETAFELSCLCVKAPWANQIVTGKKKIEYRSSLTTKRGRIGIIQSGTGTIIGDVEITGADWGKEFAEWHLKNPRKYKTPIPYKHPSGAVVWVRVTVTEKQIAKALK